MTGPAGGARLPRQQGRDADTSPRRPAQSGDRVEVTSGRYAGQTGLVVGIRLDGQGRWAAVVLDAGDRLRHFMEGLLRILD